MIELAVEYFLVVFLMCLAVIQTAGNYNHLAGIVFIQNRLVSFIVSAMTLVPCTILLLTWNRRNETGIVEGAQQFGLFMAALVGSILLTALITSITNHARFKNNTQPLGTGVEALRNRTYFQAMRLRLRSSK